MDDKWTVLSPSSRLAGACHRVVSSSRHFPFPFLFFHSRGIHIYYPGMNRDLPPSHPLHLLFLALLAFVSVTTCPCHLIFSHPPHTRQPTKRHQSHHPITSQIFRSPHTSHSESASPPLTSSLPHLTSPAIASILLRLPRTHLAAMCFS